MSYTLFSLETRKARKAHRCIWCGQAINAGDTYRDERSVYDGGIQRHRWHPECLLAGSEEFKREGPDFDAYDNQRPTDGGADD